MQKKRYLFICTFGPVQSFIAKARKVIDYQNGSALLSYFTDKLINEYNSKINENPLFNSDDSNIIYPAIRIKSKPNRFIANLYVKDENKNEHEIKEQIEHLGKALDDFFFDEILQLFNNIIIKFTTHSNIAQLNPNSINYAKHQIRNFFEFYWLALPYDSDLSYGKNYENLENWLGATKNRRIIVQTAENGERGAKCSLCGENNALFFYDEQRAFAHEFVVIFNEYRRHIMDKKEGLCAICLIKRFLEEVIRTISYRLDPIAMNSTAGISIGNVLGVNCYSELFISYLQLFESQGKKYFDEDFYFRENVSEENLNRNIRDNFEPIIDWFEKNKGAFDDSIWSKYYALLMFDGDDMGKWISGAYLKEDVNLESFHNNMSKSLGDYSVAVGKIFEKYNGLIVYAAGDDNCGFVNLKHLFDLLIELKKEFPHFEELEKNSLINNNMKSTLSCGVCIAHYKEPLTRVIEKTRQMERLAKDVPNKDAVAIAVLKKSGDIEKTVFKWNYIIENDENNQIIINSFELLKRIANKLTDEVFSNTFFRSLEKEFWWLRSNKLKLNEEQLTDILNLLNEELKRLFYRAVLMNKTKTNITRQELANEDHELNWDILEPLKIIMKSLNFSDFCSYLKICDFINSKCMNYNQIQGTY